MSKPGFYAVNKGHRIGVFTTWEECSSSVRGYPGAKYKKFTNQVDAEQFAGVQMATVSPFTSAPSPTRTNYIARPITRPVALNPPPFPQNHIQTKISSTGQPVSATSQKATVKNVFGSPSCQSSPLRVDNQSMYDVVYTDGACKGNGKAGSVAGIGVWWGQNDPRNISERCPGAQTNNRAELIAIARVLETTPLSEKPLLIKTDSQYSRDCFDKWIHSWKKNGWKNSSNQPVKNKEIIQYISRLIEYRRGLGQVQLQYVKGHSGDEGNDGADQLAVNGCQMPELPERDWDTVRSLAENPLSENKKTHAVDDIENIDWDAMADVILSDNDFEKEWISERRSGDTYC